MAAESITLVARQHIQNFSAADTLEPHWGYSGRVIPCTNDPGSCEYLDVVYHSHDLGMLYSGIIWATIGGILFVWAICRHLYPPAKRNEMVPTPPSGEKSPATGGIHRLKETIATYSRRYLLPEFVRPIFGRTTRLQVLILAVLVGYLTIWSFVGIVYNTWITPVRNSPGVFNTRTSLGPWADRVGVLAYALTPLSIMLSSRESLISLITGVPYQHFNFLHRWLGYVIFIQSALHTIGWCVIEMRLYQPQPSVGLHWIAQLYMIWGVIAMFLLTFIFLFSFPWMIRKTGYEFFRKAHYIIGMIYIGACWGHWPQLSCFMIPSLILWLVDRGVRFIRTGLLHYNYLPNGGMGFRPAHAQISHFPDSEHGDVVRLDFVHPQDPWRIGEHFYLCFPEIGMWQSHPFTPLSLPGSRGDGQVHSYILRAKKGATKLLADLAAAKAMPGPAGKQMANSIPSTTPVILTGPYGGSIIEHLTPETNVLCVAGGTGITFVLPVLLDLVNNPVKQDRRVELILMVRKEHDLAWIRDELETLRRASAQYNLKIYVHVTREDAGQHNTTQKAVDSKPVVVEETVAEKAAPSSSSLSSSDAKKSCSSYDESYTVTHASSTATADSRHPDLHAMVNRFVSTTARGPTTVFASGPGGMISELRKIVASCNDGRRVWRGEERGSVKLVCDDRLEW